MTYFIETIIGFAYLNKVTEVKLIKWSDTIKPLLLKILNASIMAIGMYFVFKIFDLQLDTSRTIWVALLTVVTAIYGGVSYLLGSYLFKIKEFDDIRKYALDFFSNIKKRLKQK
jgi:multidrug transporter EmrE-like cation transporter